MNIVVHTAEGRSFVRPDTTWERDAEDLYVSEEFKSLSYTPVVFVRICKPGRSVAAKFATRYFDSVGAGVLLYPTELLESGAVGFAEACCVDHTSFLQLPGLDPAAAADASISVSKDGACIFEHAPVSIEDICRAIESATARIYIRTGDLLAIELDEVRTLCTSRSEICTKYGNSESRFGIVF